MDLLLHRVSSLCPGGRKEHHGFGGLAPLSRNGSRTHSQAGLALLRSLSTQSLLEATLETALLNMARIHALILDEATKEGLRFCLGSYIVIVLLRLRRPEDLRCRTQIFCAALT